MITFPLKNWGTALPLAALISLMGCGGPEEVQSQEVELGSVHQESLVSDGAFLFRYGTFGGNGRTCQTCHLASTGTVNPAQLQARYAANPYDPMFRPLDSDNGLGSSYSRLLNNATILVTLPLPPNASLANNPTARTITLQRGIPSTLDTPALDPVLMADGRAPTLQAQALDAIGGHAQNTVAPTQYQLNAIAAYEKTLFSSSALRNYANGTGPLPGLPPGNTPSEKRGRVFFNPEGLCGSCHSGALLNEIPVNNGLGLPPGLDFISHMVSELNPGNLPVQTLVITNPDGTTTTVSTPDPGRFLITGNNADLNAFKITGVRNIKNTAPYFHDNSAKTLEELMEHYANVFMVIDGIVITPQEQADIIAYMKLL
jgi:cytochrome c peroxidase